MMRCDDNENKDECVENECVNNIENEYADVMCRWILYIILKSNSNSKVNMWQSNEV